MFADTPCWFNKLKAMPQPLPCFRRPWWFLKISPQLTGENCSIKFPKVRKSFSRQVFSRFIYLEQDWWAGQASRYTFHFATWLGTFLCAATKLEKKTSFNPGATNNNINNNNSTAERVKMVKNHWSMILMAAQKSRRMGHGYPCSWVSNSFNLRAT